MKHRRIRLAGITLSLNANRAGASVILSLAGPLWNYFVGLVRGPRRSNPDGDHGSMAQLTNVEAGPEDDFRQQVDGMYWYHTHDFGDGIKTRGQFDHAPILERYCLPGDVSGKRVLDVATFDGFWAFEFERRGASEVVALDLDRPAQLDWQPARLARATESELALRFGAGFELAKARFGSSVRRVCGNVYELDTLGLGTFDIVHAGDFLLHLKNPVLALQNMAKVCTGYALISEVYAPELDIAGQGSLAEYLGGGQDVTWWRFSLSTLRQMILDAGFGRVETLAKFRYGQSGMAENMCHVVFRAWKN
ncbi:MAG: class I SAM-dependent methyltransferase [Luteimonas sp.]